ncbi:MAG: peptidyl-alpha-hydroxyglycine alpha-amidating lyase family protein [Halobacteriales archaeon]
MEYEIDGQAYELNEEWADLPAGDSFVDIGRICIDADDTVLVLNRSDKPVMEFSPTGERLSTWGTGYFSDRPHGMGLGPDGAVYCTDDGNHTVRKFTRDGELVMTLGTENEPTDTGYRHVSDIFERIASITHGAGPFNGPTGVTILDSGTIYVSDGYGNARIHEFSPEGELRDSWGAPGPHPGEFRLPHAITHDEENRLWVTDRENSRIQVFEADGTFIDEWRDVIRPTDLAIADGKVFVSELCRRLSVFSTDGELLARWDNRGHPADEPLFYAPHAVAVDSTGDIFVGEVPVTIENIDRGARTLRKFERMD